MTTLIFVRHGETEHNVHGLISSAHPGPGLNANGREQARRLAEELSSLSTDRFYTSPLLRARETANVLVGQRGIVPIISPALRESGVGLLEGRGDAAAFDRYHEAVSYTHLTLPTIYSV